MFMYSMKLRRGKIILALSCFIVVVIVGIAFMTTTVDVFGAKKSDKTSSTLVTTNDERIFFLQTFGWEIQSEPNEIVEITIPSEFNDVYESYNQIQKKQGFDLEKYKGKRVKRWNYKVTNYPESTEDVYANILIYEDKIIGGDICSLALGGFMHGFEAKSKSE